MFCFGQPGRGATRSANSARVGAWLNDGLVSTYNCGFGDDWQIDIKVETAVKREPGSARPPA